MTTALVTCGLLTTLAQSLELPRASLDFLRDMTRDVIAAAHVSPPNSEVGFALIMPGGHSNYPSYWIRDFAMSLDAGFVTSDEMRAHLELAARCQNGSQPRLLAHGLVVPPYAIPDHITFAGKAVFYPGTYATGDDQGDGTFGKRPPIDDHYEFVHIAYQLFRATSSVRFLDDEIDGLSLWRRVLAAFEAPTCNAESGLVITSEAERAVGFGFCDGVVLTGKLLFASLLRYRAAGEIAEISAARQEVERAEACRKLRDRIAASIAHTFRDPVRLDGWLMAATGIGRQADVWGTLYALHLGVLRGADADQASRSVVAAVRAQTICHDGAVRHVPSDRDASPTSAWERTCGIALGTYQNGAYWHTATGWLVTAVARVDAELATSVFESFIAHLRKQDFRIGAGHEAPWECFGGDGQHAQNGVYMTSVSVPYAVLSSAMPARR